MIAWIYLDKKAAAVEALKDYTAMVFIITSHTNAVAELRERMTALPSPQPNSQPRTHNLHANEARIAAQLDKIDVLKERYRQALEYMEWFQPAWDELSEEEQLVLTEFFATDGTKLEAVGRIGNRLFLEKSQIYYKKDKALNHLVLLLYGK